MSWHDMYVTPPMLYLTRYYLGVQLIHSECETNSYFSSILLFIINARNPQSDGRVSNVVSPSNRVVYWRNQGRARSWNPVPLSHEYVQPLCVMFLTLFRFNLLLIDLKNSLRLSPLQERKCSRNSISPQDKYNTRQYRISVLKRYSQKHWQS